MYARRRLSRTHCGKATVGCSDGAGNSDTSRTGDNIVNGMAQNEAERDPTSSIRIDALE